jgi:hypothetical protein
VDYEARAIKAFVNNNSSVYVPKSDDYEIRLINFLIEIALLQKVVPFPK